MKWRDLASAGIGNRNSATAVEGVATPFLYIAIVLANIGVLVADLYTPLGVAVWIVYLVPVTLSFWLWRAEVPLVLALIATVMMIATFMTDAPGADRTIAQINRGFGILTVWIMAVVGYFFIKSRLAVYHQQWLQSGQTQLSEILRGEHSIEQLSTSILEFLTHYVDAHVAAIYVGDYKEMYLLATHGAPKSGKVPESITAGDGLVGQALSSKQAILLSDIPDGYLYLSSAFGEGKPRHLLITPIEADGRVNGVVELGFLREVGPGTVELLRRLSESMGVAIRSTEYRKNLHDLLEETQRQAEELETQSEELRVSNEELEEQGKALKETQRHLELQQVELEQTNTQLEEQAQQLESQRDELAKATEELEARARQLERASQYKSDFLANMSHELRTPLNSSLILAKLLADNPQGNLTEEQVRSARTILSSGNDLLNLINDILDLSKIEAGRMEIRAERVWLERLVGDLKRTFTPLARNKQIEFDISLAPDAPEHLFTDVQRLTQILTNLLSNAIKFTEQGRVALDIAPAASGRVAFMVSDTGIGIPTDQQRVIFDAFHQVDGAANRKFGGTGLGLSIARQLTSLLGGDIRLESQVGQGTTFTVELPLEIPATASTRGAPSRSPGTAGPAAAPAPSSEESAPSPPAPALPQRQVPLRRDDRDALGEGDRTLLVVEDDPPFVDILYDLAHELGFKCLIAGTAEDALGMVRRYLPSAVLLDVGLPDQSGLSVLEQLKSDSRLRHIPVHIVSASDYTEAALSMGAVGYMLKPVTRASLVEAFEGLSAKLVQKMRRVLLVEDDPVQQESMRELLGSQDVETVGVSSAAECLGQLMTSTFDCMVLDLSLPDASGFTLLETLSREEAYSFPPVIVYTGRDLSSEEEQQLRRYSSSIIIKGAKSPERLLDEVTLFLHQVVEDLPLAQQQMIHSARSRESAIENRRILVVEDDVRNVFALTSVLEPRGALIEIARNGKEAIEALETSLKDPEKRIDLVLMDVMMPEMDGLTATRLIRQRPEFKKLPILVLTAKAMKEDQQNCLAAGANDYMAKPLDVDKLLSLIRVWMPK